MKIKWSKEEYDKVEVVKETAVLLKDEYVCSVSEYEDDCLLVGCMKTQDLVKFENYTEGVRIISDGVHNDNKNWLEKLPGFHPETYPFMVCGGKDLISLVNMKTCKLQALINTPVSPYYKQPGALFLPLKESL